MTQFVASIKAQGKENAVWIAAFVALNILSGILTVAGYQQGGYEVNGILRYALGQNLFWLYKLPLIVVAVGVLLAIATEYPKQVKWAFTGLAGLFTAVCLFNFVGVVL